MARRHIIPVFIPHAGCPHACVFCDQTKITGADTPVTPEQVRLEIAAGAENAGKGCEVAFYGGSFTAIAPETQERLLGAVQPFFSDGTVAALRLSTRPDAIDEDTVLRLKKYGVTTVELGCQSMSDRVLTLSERGHTAAQIENAVRFLREGEFQIILQMMTGLPGDTGEESVETAKRLIALRPDGVRIYPTVVLRGTKLERMWRNGEYIPQTPEQAAELCAELYELFLAADIPVIRVGLNPTELLSDGEAVAGAYHPALGELTLSRMYLKRAERLLENFDGGGAGLHVHPKRMSVMIGQKKSNMLALQRKFPDVKLKVVPDAAELWEISLQNI